MGLFKDLRSSILEDNFKIIYMNNKIDIINYLDILHFDSNKIIINTKELNVTISGKNLIVSKLLSDELLIEGDINNISLGDNYEK